MKATTLATLLVLAAALAGGCATRHTMASPVPSFAEAGLVTDPKQVGELEKAMTDSGIAKLLEMDVRAKVPTRLALARIVKPYPRSDPELEQVSAEELAQWQGALVDGKYITGVQAVPELAVNRYASEARAIAEAAAGRPAELKDTMLRSLRVAAAKMRCELLLVYVQGDSEVDNFNDLAALYWTFVGMWLVPGNDLEHRTVMQALIVDCRTGAILGTATGDTHLVRVAPLALSGIPKGKMAAEAPRQTLADLQAACKRLLADIIQRAVGKQVKP